MSIKTLEISLNTLKLLKDLHKTKGRYLLTSSLVYPRNNIPSVSSEKTITKSDELQKLNNKPYPIKVLFKEDVSSDTGIIFTLARIRKPGKYKKFLSGVVSGLSGLSGFPGASSLFGLLLKTATNSLATDLQDEDLDIVGIGTLDINANDIEKSPSVTLKAANKITVFNITEDEKDGDDGGDDGGDDWDDDYDAGTSPDSVTIGVGEAVLELTLSIKQLI